MNTLSSPLSASSIKSAVSEMLDQDIAIPEGHNGALVTLINGDRVEVALATKVIHNNKVTWDVELKGEHRWTGGNQFAVMNKVTW
jgi:hypothetical protein